MNPKKQYIKEIFTIEGTFETETITESLGLLPDKVREGAKGRKKLYWEIYHDKTGDTDPLLSYDLLQKMEAIFMPKMETLQELKEQYDLKYKINLHVYVNDIDPGLRFSPAIVRFLKILGAAVSMEIHVVPLGIHRVTEVWKRILTKRLQRGR